MASLRDILMSDQPGQVLRDLFAQGVLADVEPSLVALRMDIPAGYHHKDNLEHSFKVLENAIARETDGPDLILRTAALFHDIGKPRTRKFFKGGRVTFDAHEAVGARMMRRMLPKHGYSHEETLTVSKLVALHMRSYGYDDDRWTDSGVRRLLTDVGSEEDFQRLVVLFYSDVTSKKKSVQDAVHTSVSALVSMAGKVREQDARAALRPALNGNQVMERFGLTPGAELGKVMRYLNSDEGVTLSETDIMKVVPEKFGHQPV